MSWSLIVEVPVGADVHEAVAAAESSPPQATADAEVKEQIAAAKQAAVLLLTSAAVGREKTFRVTVYGHANPGHEPQDGYVTDQIRVEVVQLQSTPAEE